MQISTDQFWEAANRLGGMINQTKLIYSSAFSNESANQVWLKPENLQITGSFKIRGAYNKIAKLSEQEKQQGLIASSAGNHAQGVAYAAQKLGVDVTIVMPQTAPLIKVEATKGYGAKVELYGGGYDDAYSEAVRLQQENNYIFVHPFNDLDVIEGQGTIALEVLAELPEADCLLVPIGGGGLISGVAMAAKALKPGIKVIGVEPEGAQAMKVSVEHNKIVFLDTVDTIADGVAVKNPGDVTFPIIRNYVDEIVTVSDFDIMEAFLLLLDKHKLVGENAGVLSLAGLKKIKERDKNIISIVSGGNIDVLTISAMINRGLFSRGRIFSFSVDLPDRPGELLKISEILARLNANIIKLDHNQFKTFHRFMDVQLEVTVETNGHKHIRRITEELEKAGYNLTKVY
ncbi:MAG: threonine ammonia-lyase [Bacillota bacterium]|nr:threonine ammonia-lyase [Bacillota bacterium]